MHLRNSLLTLASSVALTAAHFDLVEPPSRGPNHETQTKFPCGGTSVTQNRTSVSISDPTLHIQLDMGHDHSAVQVLLGLGNDPDPNFNITLVPTFGEMGMGDFCLQNIDLSEKVLGVPLTEGLNATLQVVTNGENGGGLYNCADLTFGGSSTEGSKCTNGTGIQAMAFSGDAAKRNANESTADGQAMSGGSSGGSGGSSGGEDKPSSSPRNVAFTWGLLAVVVGASAVL